MKACRLSGGEVKMNKEIETLALWLQKAHYAVVLTGAGMSTEARVPDFRSREGWWKKIDPRTVATVEAMYHHYELFHDFYRMRVQLLKGCKPHKGHDILAQWEKNGLLQAIVTQNVDGFHSAAGNHRVYELHGSIRSFRCVSCGQPATEETFLKKELCKRCGGNLRPNVVLFGESLPQESWHAAMAEIQKSDLVIVIGTSLEVYPASQLPQMTTGKTVYINLEADEHHYFDLVIQGKAGEVLQQVDKRLKDVKGC